MKMLFKYPDKDNFVLDVVLSPYAESAMPPGPNAIELDGRLFRRVERRRHTPAVFGRRHGYDRRRSAAPERRLGLRDRRRG